MFPSCDDWRRLKPRKCSARWSKMHLLQTSVTRLYSEPFTSRVVSRSYQTDLLFWVTETGIVGEVFTANRLRMACCEAALCRVDLLGKLPGGRKRCNKRRILKTLLALSLSSWEKWCSCYPAAVLENPWPFHCCPKENPSVCFQLWRNKFFFLFYWTSPEERFEFSL